MDRSELSVAIITEIETVVHTALEEAVPAMLNADLATMERQAQEVGRLILGHLIEVMVRQRERAQPCRVRCPQCGGRLGQRARVRHLQGLVGDYRLARTY